MSFLKSTLQISIKSFLAASFGILGLFSTLFILLFVVIAIGAAASSAESQTDPEQEVIFGDADARATFASIKINGIILGEPATDDEFFSLFDEVGITYGYDVKEELSALAADGSIDGVILEIDSPGGTIFGSKAIADGIEGYKRVTDKPVVVFVSGSAASGAYWAAASSDVIFADSGTMIGSIGVILGPFKRYSSVVGEAEAFGGAIQTTEDIETSFITAGEAKDLGNPYRDMTEKEKNILQKMVDNSYEEFVTHVAQQRNLSTQEIKDQIGAYIYDEIQAKELNLIDDVASKEVAYARLAELAGQKESFNVVRVLGPTGFFDVLLGAVSGMKNQEVQQPSPVQQLCSTNPRVLALELTASGFCQ